jgi:hypothetical protein
MLGVHPHLIHMRQQAWTTKILVFLLLYCTQILIDNCNHGSEN